MLKELEKNAKHRARTVGFVDDRRKNNIISGKRVLGTTEQIPSLIRKHRIKKVFIAMPSAAKEEIRRIVGICQGCSVETKIMQQSEFTALGQDRSEEGYPIMPVSIYDLLGRGEIDLNVEEISSYLTARTVLVTGAGGSIGSALCKQIVRFRPQKLVLFDFYENNMYSLEQELAIAKLHGFISPDLEIVSEVGSVREKDLLLSVFMQHKPNVVFHAAAHKHVPLMEHSPREAIKNNVFGTKNVIEASLEAGSERFILISTDKAVKPANVMGASKRMGELVMQSFAATSAMSMAAVRFGNVLGSSGSVIPLFEKQIAQGGPLTLTHRDVERYFMTIPEAAQLVMQAGSFAAHGEIFVLDMGEPVRILDLAEKMIRLSGYVPYDEIDIVEIGLRPGEKMHEELSLFEEDLIPTSNKAIHAAQPVLLPEGLLEESLNELSSLLRSGALNEELRNALLAMANGTPAGARGGKPANWS
jgi:FlaA1/EpsC-like NDP-sugar epimerase